MTIHKSLCLVLCVVAVTSCKNPSPEMDDKQLPAEAAPAVIPSPSDQTADQDKDQNGIYTGFDGVNSYSVLVPGFLNFSADDQSVVRVEKLSVQLSEETITELLTAERAKNPQFDEARFRKMMQRQRPAYRLVPVKAGVATLSVAGGRGPQGGGAGWSKGKTVKVYVAAYTSQMFQTGQAR